MSNLIRKYGVSFAFLFAFATMAMTVGNTLTIVQNRQAHEIEAIRFLMSGAMHGHTLTHLPARRPNPVAVPATTLI
jgi:hypothetical protein